MPKVGSDDYVLPVDGFRLDTVREVGDSLPSDPDEAARTILRQWYTLARRISDKPIEFWVTLVMDTDTYFNRLQGAESQRLKRAVDRYSQNPRSTQSMADSDFRYLFGLTRKSYRFFVTANGRMGMGPPDMEVGDPVCILFGGQTPYILRKREVVNQESEDGYRLIGECYLHGVMDGESMKQLEKGEFHEETFVLN
jgi:hypothetical protein